VQVSKRPAEDAHPPADPISSSFSAEYLALLGTWPGMVSLPSKNMPLSIGPFPIGLPIGPHPPLHGPGISPTTVLLGYLGPFWLPLLPCSSKLPVGRPWSRWISR